MTHDEQIVHVVEGVRNFRERLTRRIIDEFPTLRARLSRINDLVGSVDHSHLSYVPVSILAALIHQMERAVESINSYMAVSFPPEAQSSDGVVRPIAHIRNRENIRRWESHLDDVHRHLYELTAPIISHQRHRLARIASTTRIDVDHATFNLRGSEDDAVWRYMPLSNLIRCEVNSGIWFSSLEKLRAWSEHGIVDTKEGDVPPLLSDLKQAYELAVIGSDRAVTDFKLRYGIDDDGFSRLHEILADSLDTQTVFVSSWARKRAESSSMWLHYGDRGQGIAIKTRISKLVGCEWRVPEELCGARGANRFLKLRLRAVKYLNFNDSDRLESVDDLYLPFLKRIEFEDEHEVRLVGFTKAPMESQGLMLHCNLHDLLEEIVVGPHGDLEQTQHWIALHASDLKGVSIRKSTLGM